MNDYSICPTITAYNLQQYNEQLSKLSKLTNKLHIDLMDGNLAPTVSINISEIHWPNEIKPDIHMMYKQPMLCLNQVIKLSPRLLIVHIESIVDHEYLTNKLHQSGIKCGIALLQDTPIKSLDTVIDIYDHVLIFSGHLGYHGGVANLDHLDKVKYIKDKYPDKEIGWDGGINDKNIKQIYSCGVKVFDVGGYISNNDPKNAYATLEKELNSD